MSKAAIGKAITEPAQWAVSEIGERLLKRVAPELLQTVGKRTKLPKVNVPKPKNVPALDDFRRFLSETSDDTLLKLDNTAAMDGDRLETVRKLLIEGVNGNTEPLLKYNAIHQEFPLSKQLPTNATRPRMRQYDPTPEGRALARSDFKKWLDPEISRAGGDIKKVRRGDYAPEGVFFGDKKQGIKGLTEYSRGGEDPNFYNVGPLEERAFQLNPESHPMIADFFTQGHARFEATGGAEGVDPRLTFADFKKYVTKTSRAMDNATARLRRLWEAKTPTKGPMGNRGGIKIGGRQADIPRAYDTAKEHMIAAGNEASDVGDSQVVGNQFYNQMMGKLDSFSQRIMGDILNLPGGGGGRGQQQGWMKAATDWVGARKFDTDGNVVIDENFLGIRLDNSDKIRIQQAQFNHSNVNKKGPFRVAITGQEQVAMKVLAEKEITEAYLSAGLGQVPEEEEILWKLLMEIGNTMQINRAKAISPEGQLRLLALDNPGKTLDELKELVKEVEGTTVQTSKTGFRKQEFGTTKPKAGVVTKLPREKPLSDSEFLARVAPGKKKAEEKSIKQYVKGKIKEVKKKPEIVELKEMEYQPTEYLEEFAMDQRYEN